MRFPTMWYVRRADPLLFFYQLFIEPWHVISNNVAFWHV